MILTSHKGATWAWEAQVLSHLYVCSNQFDITYHVWFNKYKTKIDQYKWIWVEIDCTFFMRDTNAMYASKTQVGSLCDFQILAIWVLAAIASKIFLVAIADLLDTLWHKVLDDMYTLSFSEVPFGCQQQRQSEALKGTWACEAHVGPLSQAFIPMSLGGAFFRNIFVKLQANV